MGNTTSTTPVATLFRDALNDACVYVNTGDVDNIVATQYGSSDSKSDSIGMNEFIIIPINDINTDKTLTLGSVDNLTTQQETTQQNFTSFNSESREIPVEDKSISESFANESVSDSISESVSNENSIESIKPLLKSIDKSLQNIDKSLEYSQYSQPRPKQQETFVEEFSNTNEENTENLVNTIINNIDKNQLSIQQLGGYRRKCNKKSMKGGYYCGKTTSTKFNDDKVDMRKY